MCQSNLEHLSDKTIDRELRQESRDLMAILSEKKSLAESLNKENDRLLVLVETLSKDVSLLTDEFVEKTSAVDVLDKQIVTLNEDIDALRIESNALHEEIGERTAMLNSLAKVTNELEEKTEELSSVGTRLIHNKNILDETIRQVELHKAQLSTTNSQLNVLQVKLVDFEKKQALLDEQQRNIKHIEKDVSIKWEATLASEERMIKLKKEFIENPLSIGYYATLIREKTGIDVIEVIRKK